MALAYFMNVQRYNANKISLMKQIENDPTGRLISTCRKHVIQIEDLYISAKHVKSFLQDPIAKTTREATK
jgi:hypothetical protein